MAHYIEGDSNDGRVPLELKGKGTRYTLLHFGATGVPTIPYGVSLDVTGDIINMPLTPSTPDSSLINPGPPAGLYLLSVLLVGQASDPTAGTLQVFITWSGSGDEEDLTLDLADASFPQPQTSRSRPIWIKNRASVPIVNVANTGSYGTAHAQLIICLLPLMPLAVEA